MKQWDDKDLDRLIDRTLSEYATEARDGLEQRVLANVGAAGAQPRRWWIWIAVPAFAMVVVVAMLVWTSAQNRPIAPPEIAKGPKAPEVVKVPPRQQRAIRVVARKPALRRSKPQIVAISPKLPSFPSQTDDTQVRLALRFVQNNPALAQQVVKEEEEFQEATARNFALQDRQNGSETQ